MKLIGPIYFLHNLHGYYLVVDVFILILNYDNAGSSLNDGVIISQICVAKERRIFVL